MSNTVTVSFEVSNEQELATIMRRARGEVESFDEGTRKAARSGSQLGDVFKGTLLADYFQRGASAALDFARSAVQASAAASDANRVLASSATQAGVSYTRAAEQAEDFAKRVGLSNAEAARTFAEIQRLASQAGRAEDADLISRRFADLAASRGIRANQLTEIAQQIAAGTSDEALNKLGAGDPGRLYIDYAKSLKTTADALDDTEKAQARLNAIMRLGENVQGEAARRAGDTAGQLDSASAAYENMTAQVGDAITSSMEFRNALGFINDALSSVLTSHENARRELAKGLKTPQQIAEEQASSTFNQISDFATTQSARVLAGLNTATQVVFGEGILNRFGFSDEVIEQSITGVTERRKAELLKGAQQLQQDVQRQEREARERGQENARDRQASREATEARQREQDAKRHAQEVQSAYKSALDFIDDIAARSSGGENPFIKLFAAGETAAERMQERFGALGSEVVNQFTAMERQAVAFETATERIQRGLKAVELEFRAEQLLMPPTGISAEQGRQLGILQKQFAALTNVPGLNREAEAYERGFRPQNQLLERREMFADYERVKGLRPQGSDEAARAAQKMVDDYILAQTQGLSISARFSPDSRTRQLAADRAGALRAQAGRFEAEIQDERERAEANRANIQLANRQLQELGRNAPGLDPDVLRKEFLNITRAIDPKELSGQMRQAMGLALREEAQHERQLEQQAQSFREKLVGAGGVLYQIRDALAASKPGAAASVSGAAGVPTPEEVSKGIQSFEARQFGASPSGNSLISFLQGNARAATAPGAEQADLRAKINAFVRAQVEGRFVGDPAALASANLPTVGAPVKVNTYAQDFFRARPGYDPANSPRAYDPNDPYQEAFFRAGYFNSLNSSEMAARVSGARPPEKSFSLQDVLPRETITNMGGAGAAKRGASNDPYADAKGGNPVALLTEIRDSLRVLSLDMAAGVQVKMDGEAAIIEIRNSSPNATVSDRQLGLAPRS